MNIAEKKEFIDELIGNVREDIYGELSKYPEDWAGIELRWRIADVFKQIVFGGIGARKGKRYSEYSNTVIVENLI